MTQMAEQKTVTRPPQQQKEQPGREDLMRPRPESGARRYKAAGKLEGKTALITGGDSGIGRSVAVMFAKEGADVAIVYLNEHRDADETRRLVEAEGRRCLTLAGDVARSAFCEEAVQRTVRELGKLDILVNNAAEQHVQQKIDDISEEQLRRTFETNFFGYFLMVKAALKHMKEDAAIVNTTSVTAFRGSPHLLDYSSTKGAIVAFTRSLAKALAKRRIRVNAVAPGPIWTPLIPATFPPDKVQEFGADVPLGRPGEPDEVAPCFVFLASDDSSYMTGQILHPNGGEIVGS
jgi:NAD(P)-dependent dehydrogenase (short-subunit alcohol dehydrogenase family)